MRHALLIPLALLVGHASVARADPELRRQTETPSFSLLDAETLGDHRWGFGFGAGFPYVQAMVGYDLLDGLDLDLNADSLYGVVTMFSLGPKVRLFHQSGVAFALEVQGQYAWFRQPETSDTGSRQLTGIRNWDFQPQAILSYRGHYGSIFGSLLYQGTFDTEPVSSGPLAGNPGPWTYGSNVGVHLGAEFTPLGLVHAYGILGLDFHARSGDDPVMLYAEFGLTFPS